MDGGEADEVAPTLLVAVTTDCSVWPTSALAGV
jgi:hypothetical protein